MSPKKIVKRKKTREQKEIKKNALKNVLITGVTSTIGRMLAQQLYFDKRVGKIIGIAIDPKPYYFDDYSSERFIYIRSNILKYRELNNLFLSPTFKSANIDTVVHLAFVSSPKIPPDEAYNLNVEGTRNLLLRCLETKGINKFIFKSSMIVYKIRPHNPVLLDEDAELNLDPSADPWIRNRVDADMICRSMMDNPKMDIVVLRFSNIIGRNITSELNEFFDMKPCFVPAGYNPMVNLIHARDVVNAIQLAVHKKVRGVFNIGGRETAPLRTFLYLNKNRPIPLPHPLLKPIYSIMHRLGLSSYYYPVEQDLLRFTALPDWTKAKKILGYEPKNRVKFG